MNALRGLRSFLRDAGVAALRIGAGILSACVLKRAHWHTIRGFDLWDYSNRLDDFARGKPWRSGT